MKKDNVIDANVNMFLHKVVIIFLIIAAVIFIAFTVVYMRNNVIILEFLMGMCAVQHIVWLLIFLFFKKDIPIEPLVIMYLAYIHIALFPTTCIYWNSGYLAAFFWYFLIPIGAIIFHEKYVVLWSVFTAVTVICVFLFSNILPVMDFTLMIREFSFLTIISAIILSVFFTIVFVRMNKINESVQIKTAILQTKVDNSENLEKDKALYREIIEYLEHHKPFTNSDFNANMLATALNTHPNYISRAINIGTSGVENFNMLINNFRIEYAKTLLNSDALKKYTIDYVYTKVGYKHRSTFNTAFKNITGVTPTDYVAQQNKKDDFCQ
jgi:AraC-like DNA-binding protein